MGDGLKDIWKYRRRWVVSTTIMCFFWVSWIVVTGQDTAVATTIVVSAFSALTAIGGFYMSVSAYDHNSQRKYGFVPELPGFDTKVPEHLQGVGVGNINT